MPVSYTRESLAEAVARSSTWADLMRTLEVKASGGRRRTLREVVDKLGARPATGTLSHIRRRITASGIDVSHIPGLNRARVDLPFSPQQLREAAASGDSVRAAARLLGVSDDGRSRAALRRMPHEHGIDTSHFSHPRVTIPEGPLRAAVANSTSYAEVMRALALPVNDANHRRVQVRTVQLGLDTTHFTRQTRRAIRPVASKPIADEVLRILPKGSYRINRARLCAALDEIGLPYECTRCGNTGQWQGKAMTLQIDHINGDWLDNRRGNLRYLCPNCHSITATWCGRDRRKERRATA